MPRPARNLIKDRRIYLTLFFPRSDSNGAGHVASRINSPASGQSTGEVMREERKSLMRFSGWWVWSARGRTTASRASASSQSSSEADCHCEFRATKSKESFVHESGPVVDDLSSVRRRAQR